MSIEVMENGVHVNATGSWLFGGWYCQNCPHRVHVGGREPYTCGAQFMPIDDDRDVFAVDGESHTAGYIIYDNDSCGDGGRLLACKGMCERRAAQCADGEPYAYYVEYIYNESTGDYNTRQYAYDNLYYCEECGDWFESYDYDTDADMCNTCASRRGIIGDWHDHKGDFVPVGDRHDRKRIGFELEVDDGDGDNESMAREIDCEFPSHFVFENDCSLETGFEIISQPHTRDALNALDIERLCRMLSANDYTSHDRGTCGFHVHYSVDWFGVDDDEQRATLARVLRWYEEYFDDMATLSRRGDGYSNYADINSRAQSWDYYDVVVDDDDDLVEHCIGASRYVAVNCCNFYRYGTVEFRLCRGSLKASTLRAWIDLHTAIITACRLNISPTWDTVLSHCDRLETREYVRSKLDI